ncbi:DUF6318 family protein [Nocardioides donggukensis]|uniref:DUF6318 domain-containing protein n=1 Tax=Nocardioides donggukensis TaxID=2774019 RepID=A0A927K4J1_9ACTN|nr:DUF6318 family protein [Nocardioides donggukensis]MBD8870567.1 hypothetical protein [Nocardioides donggukensis]
MRVRRWGAGLVWVPLVLPLMLSGCSDADGSSSPSTPSSPSQQSSPSPDATPTDEGLSIPSEAVGTDEASAKAFVRYWFEVLSEAMTTGDTKAALALSTKQCQSCQSITGRIDNVYNKGGRLKTDGWFADRFVPDSPSKLKTPAYFIRVRQSPRALINSDGEVVDRTMREATAMRIVLKRSSGAWRVSRLDVIR